MTTISHEQAKGAATRLIAAAFRRDGERLPYDKRPRFSIPCRPDRDDDTVIVAYIDQQAALISSQARRIAELEAVYDAARGLCYGEDWNNGTHAKSRGYRQKLVAAVNAIEPLFATAIRARWEAPPNAKKPAPA